MPISTTIKPQKKSLFPCLVLCGGLGFMTITAHCQPPVPATESFIKSIDQDWQKLRQTTGEQEFLNPQDTITRYQKFYETEGFRSGQTAVEITNIIAQLYWQGMRNPQKALSIYDWGLKNLNQYPHFKILQEGRALVAKSGKFEDTVNVSQDNAATAPKTVDTVKTVTVVIPATPTKVLLPATLDTDKAPGATLSPTNTPFALVTVAPLINTEKATPKDLTVTVSPTSNSATTIDPIHNVNPTSVGNPAQAGNAITTVSPVHIANPTSTGNTASPVIPVHIANPTSTGNTISPVIPANPRVGEAGIQAVPLNKSTFTPVTITPPEPPSTTKVLSVTPPALSTTNISAPTGINVRQLQLVNSALTIRSGKTTVDAFLSNDNPTAKEALWMLSAPGVIKSWDDNKPLRLALVGFIQQQSPDLLQDPALPLPTQVALAQYYASQRSPKAAAMYKALLAQKLPSGSWFSALRLMFDQSDYYEKMGQYDEAAQALLAVQKIVPTAFFIGDTNIGAARLYMRAGETEKAMALYKEAEKSTFGWAASIAFLDQGRALMAQHKYEEAIKVLSTPVSGRYADQIEPIKRMMIGDIYFAVGDLTKAQENMQTAIAAFYALKNPLQGEGLQNIFTSAQKRLQDVDRWIKEAIQVDPKEVHITVDTKQLQRGPIIARLHVSTYRDAPLTVTSDNTDVTAQILSLNEWSEADATNANRQSDKEVIIKVTAMPPQGGSKALLTISSTKYPEFVAQVMVYLDVAGM